MAAWVGTNGAPITLRGIMTPWNGTCLASRLRAPLPTSPRHPHRRRAPRRRRRPRARCRPRARPGRAPPRALQPARAAELQLRQRPLNGRDRRHRRRRRRGDRHHWPRHLLLHAPPQHAAYRVGPGGEPAPGRDGRGRVLFRRRRAAAAGRGPGRASRCPTRRTPERRARAWRQPNSYPTQARAAAPSIDPAPRPRFAGARTFARCPPTTVSGIFHLATRQP
jgi:hypothetical protein